VEEEETATARQRLDKHVSAPTDELCEVVFSMRFLPRLSNENLRVGEARSNTSTVVLRVVGSDEKELSNLRQ
jgi:hypothetical protein